MRWRELAPIQLVRVTERFLRYPTFVGHLSGRLAIVEQDRVRFRPALTRIASEILAKKGQLKLTPNSHPAVLETRTQ